MDAQPDTVPCAFTRRFLYEGMLLNRHRDPDASTDLMLAALWLTVSGPTGDAARDPPTARRLRVLHGLTVEDEGRTNHVRSWIEDYGEEQKVA